MNTTYNFSENVDFCLENISNVARAKRELRDSIYSFYDNKRFFKQYILDTLAHYNYIMSLLQLKMTTKLVNGFVGKVYDRMRNHYNFYLELNKTAMMIYNTHCC